MTKGAARKKGATKDESFKDFALDQLADLRGLSCRAMFGGYGLYRGPRFFAIIHEGRLYFKTDEKSRTKYASKRMKPFRPTSKQTLKRYYEVPPDILEDAEALVAWATEAVTR